jgi:hypothetical protein
VSGLSDDCQEKVARAFLDQYIALIKEWLPLVPAALIFGIDECGFSDWEESKYKPVLIPSRVRKQVCMTQSSVIFVIKS